MNHTRRNVRTPRRTPRVRLHPYKLGSASGKVLSETLQIKRIATNSAFRGRAGDCVLFWGGTQARISLDDGMVIINHPQSIALACDKVSFFRTLAEHENIQTVPATESTDEVAGWLDEGCTVYARTLTNSHSGNGIVVVEPGCDAIPSAALYTRAITGGRREIRLHVINGEVVLVQQKRRREGWQESETYSNEVRNLSGGWVYSSLNVTEPPEQSYQMAIDCVAALGLDFGAVDMLTKQGECYILEVNTACGLGDEVTINAYKEALGRLIEQRTNT